MATIGIDTRSDIWSQQAADAGTTSPVGGGSPLAGENSIPGGNIPVGDGY